MAAAMPQSPLRRLALDLRFPGRCHQSGDGDGSTTLTLTLVPSGTAMTTPDVPSNLRADLYRVVPKAC